MSAIDLVRAHFDALTKREINVPEWGLTLYSTPVTLAERNKIYKAAEGEDDYVTTARILVVKATDAHGAPVFTIADIPELVRHADSSVVIRVAAEIMAAQAPKSAELGNS